jgi:hypothetical protein
VIENAFTPKSLMDLQGRMAEAVIDAAEESMKLAEKATVEAMAVPSKLRARTFDIAREACRAGAAK